MQRQDALAELQRTMREFMARAVLFHHAVAQQVGAHPTDIQAAGLLLLHGPATPGELAQRTGLTSGGAITAVIDRLERAGYVRRTRDPADRRRVIVEADEARIARDLGPIYGAVGQAWGTYLETLDDEQLAFAHELFARAAAVTEDQTARLRG